MTNKLLSLCCRQLAESEIIIEDKNAEIERLKLTDKEIEAIEWYANFHDGIHRDTLRNLLERTKDN
jgi:hypothetical protein